MRDCYTVRLVLFTATISQLLILMGFYPHERLLHSPTDVVYSHNISAPVAVSPNLLMQLPLQGSSSPTDYETLTH